MSWQTHTFGEDMARDAEALIAMIAECAPLKVPTLHKAVFGVLRQHHARGQLDATQELEGRLKGIQQSLNALVR